MGGEADRGNVFDIGLLAGRLLDATAWLREESDAEGLAVGYFGASTGAAAALWAAADPRRAARRRRLPRRPARPRRDQTVRDGGTRTHVNENGRSL
ncbi:hypothetical protein GCM10010360_21760 [Streptomyces nogalater]